MSSYLRPPRWQHGLEYVTVSLWSGLTSRTSATTFPAQWSLMIGWRCRDLVRLARIVSWRRWQRTRRWLWIWYHDKSVRNGRSRRWSRLRDFPSAFILDRWLGDILRQRPSFLNLLKVTAQGVTARCLNDGGRFSGQSRFLLLVFTTAVSIIVSFFLLLAFLTTVDVILKLNPHLSLRRLVPNKRVFEQLLRVRPLMVVLD